MMQNQDQDRRDLERSNDLRHRLEQLVREVGVGPADARREVWGVEPRQAC